LGVVGVETPGTGGGAGRVLGTEGVVVVPGSAGAGSRGAGSVSFVSAGGAGVGGTLSPEGAGPRIEGALVEGALVEGVVVPVPLIEGVVVDVVGAIGPLMLGAYFDGAVGFDQLWLDGFDWPLAHDWPVE